MKRIKTLALVSAVVFSLSTNAQRIRLVEGDLSALKNEERVNLDFSYDNMRVGKYSKEADYIADKKADYNKKEPGRGDTWEKAWFDDRETRFEPKFIQLFEENSNLKASHDTKDVKYTFIVKTTFTEPGFNIGITRRNAEINQEVLLVESANKEKVIAKITIDRAQGRTFAGLDFDTGERLSEAYADSGKAFGRFVRDKK